MIITLLRGNAIWQLIAEVELTGIVPLVDVSQR